MSYPLPEWKQIALSRFEIWLRELPDDYPDAHPNEDAVDLYTIAQELTVLKQEMKMLTRNTARLADSTNVVSDTLRAECAALLAKSASQGGSSAVGDAPRGASRNETKPLLLEFGDLLEALNELALRKQFKWPAYAPGFLRESLEAHLLKPVQVLQKRIHALLQRHLISPAVAIGDRFDATRMNATGSSSSGHVPGGCVSAIIRQGYFCSGELLRVADVLIEEEKA